MTDTNHPNEYGFAGGATAPQPADPHSGTDRESAAAEGIAVPSGDLTGSLSDGIDELTHTGDARDDDPR
jgi:hypothetical protein